MTIEPPCACGCDDVTYKCIDTSVTCPKCGGDVRAELECTDFFWIVQPRILFVVTKFVEWKNDVERSRIPFGSEKHREGLVSIPASS